MTPPISEDVKKELEKLYYEDYNFFGSYNDIMKNKSSNDFFL